MTHLKSSRVVVYIAVLSVLVFGIVVLKPSIQSAEVKEPPKEEAEFSGRFSDYCPPQWALESARGYKSQPNQTFSQEFLSHFDELTLFDKTELLKLETRGFCMFQIDGLSFVVFNDYTDSFGVRINGMQELQEWFAENGIEEDLCQLIWSQCSQIPDEEPREQGGSGIVWRLSKLLDRRHLLFQI